MKKRVGFTLVELLAVIAILAILVIIALPNVMGMFNNAKKSTFLTEIKKIYRGAEQEYVKDAFTTSGNKIYAKAKNKCSKELDMSIRDDLEYFIEINSSGKVIRFYAHDNSYQYEHEGEMTINDITDAEDVSQTSEKITISCDNVDFVEQNVLARFITGSELNIRMKTLAGDSNPTNETINENITAIIKSDTQPSEENKQSINIVSTSDSTKPIYMWYQDGTIYYYSEEEHPSLNKDSSNIFRYLTKLSDISGLSNFDTSHVRNFERLFYGCSSITTIEPLKNWNISKLNNMRAMFAGKDDYTIHITDLTPLKNWNTSKVTSMRAVFQGNVNLESLEGLENWNTSNVTTMYGMFMGNYKYIMHIKSLKPLSKWNTSKVTDMQGMFQENVDLESLEGLENWDTSNVTNMQGMFLGFDQNIMHIKSLKPLSKWNTSKVINMSGMFQTNVDLENLEGLENWNTSNVEDFDNLFYNCRNLVTADLSNFDMKNVKYFPGRVNLSGNLAENGAHIFGGDMQNLNKIITPAYYSTDTNLYIGLPIKMYDSEGNAYTRLDNTSPKQTELYSVNPKG